MATKPKNPKKGLADAPTLVSHRDIAEKFGVTTACIRYWVRHREFPTPHVVIGHTWFYKADVIAHKLRTGSWLPGVKFLGDQGSLAP